jgi:hypothetical protein
MTYATDGKCHNAEPGTYNHECGKPATWLGTKNNGFTSGFCNECKQYGYEAKAYTTWTEIELFSLFSFLDACGAHPYD